MDRPAPPIVCFSPTRFGPAGGRPQQLMNRLGRRHRIVFVEPALSTTETTPWLERRQEGAVTVTTPRLPRAILVHPVRRTMAERRLCRALFASDRLRTAVLWFYAPAALSLADGVRPRAIVYDCVDPLWHTGLRFEVARAAEAELLGRADLVLVDGSAALRDKRGRHPNVHLLPSIADVPHLRRARLLSIDPLDQEMIPHPRIGFLGPVDDRVDLALVSRVALARPDWQLVLLGNVARSERGRLPQHPNVHLLGPRTHAELPSYLAGWDAVMLPLAPGPRTALCSPIAAVEALAAGRPVVATKVGDFAALGGPHGEVVRVAEGEGAFLAALGEALAADRGELRRRAERILAESSWEETGARVAALLGRTLVAAQPRKRLAVCPPGAARVH